MTLETIDRTKKGKKTKDMTDGEILELIQSLCVHRRRGVFSEEGHRFLYCQDCEKRFYGMDI